MKRKIFLICLLIIIVLLFVSCDSYFTNITITSDIEYNMPKTNIQLFDFISDSFINRTFDDLYKYTSQEIQNLMSKKDFIHIFEDVLKISGELKNITNNSSVIENGIERFFALLHFENLDLELHIDITDVKILAVSYNVFFNRTFEIEVTGNIIERYFVLENDGHKLNAVYTYIRDGEKHPSVLLVPGSGQCDYNETIGIHKPFEDIALGLAQNGICSLRIDKRTLNYYSSFEMTAGINEEYICDFNKAIDYLKENSIGDIYLLGHSLGGQIAADLAAQNSNVSGIVLFNSSARHLAEIMKDQYINIDPQNKDIYIQYANIAKGMNKSDAKGYFYYGVSDYYWTSYNEINTVKNIEYFGKKTLIINSTYDKQTFPDDIELWQNSFGKNKTVIIQVFADISHYGYKIDTKNASSLYRKEDFPKEIIDTISNFIKDEKK